MALIQLKNVTISYPSLFSPAVFEGVEGKYEATFLIPKSDLKTKALLDQAITEAIVASKVKGKIPSEKYCLTDGDERGDESYHGSWSIKAGNKKRPTVINRAKSPITEADDIIYPGCKVDAIIDIWIQDNKWGKRVNANLYGVRFVADGEALGAGRVDVMGEFEDLDSDLDDI